MLEILSGDRPIPHRFNPDGTFDSICPVCFVTIARHVDECALAQFEHDHVCDAHLIDMRRKMVLSDQVARLARAKAG
jgi:hypothetical protein